MIRATRSAPRRAARPALAAAVLASAALTGCFDSRIVTIPSLEMTVASSAGIIAAHGIMAADPSQGPRVIFRNDADTPVQVRYWVGRYDVTRPRGVSDMRSDKGLAFIVEPGESITRRVANVPGWMTATSDAVVWARLDPGAHITLPEGEIVKLWEGSSQPQWFEITRPLPFAWRAIGTADDLRAERLGSGALAPLPEDLWIEHNVGAFPASVSATDLWGGTGL